MNKSKFNRFKSLNGLVTFSGALGAVKHITALIKGRQLVLAAILATVSVAAVAAVLTPGAGIIAAPVVARAFFVDPTDIKFKVKGHQGQEVLHVPQAKETVVQQIVIAPGGHTGWHSHPGPVVVLIKSGQMSLYSSKDPRCGAHIYSAGQAFIDHGQGHVHIARNEGSEVLELWATYFDVPAGAAQRIDAPNPGNCPF